MKGGEAAGTVLEIRVRVCTVVTVYVQYTDIHENVKEKFKRGHIKNLLSLFQCLYTMHLGIWSAYHPTKCEIRQPSQFLWAAWITKYVIQQAIQIWLPFLCHMQVHSNVSTQSLRTTFAKVHHIFLASQSEQTWLFQEGVLKRQTLKRSVSDRE